jgi:hypothetical protein
MTVCIAAKDFTHPALSDYEKATRFRVMWTMQMQNVRVSATVLYDRPTQSLKYYESGHFYGVPVRESWLYSSVNDDILQRMAAKVPGALFQRQETSRI